MDNPERRESCGDCRFFDRLGTTGFCKRFPPQVYFKVSSSERSSNLEGIKSESRPWVGQSDWCGEFQEVKKGSEDECNE